MRRGRKFWQFGSLFNAPQAKILTILITFQCLRVEKMTKKFGNFGPGILADPAISFIFLRKKFWWSAENIFQKLFPKTFYENFFQISNFFQNRFYCKNRPLFFRPPKNSLFSKNIFSQFFSSKFSKYFWFFSKIFLLFLRNFLPYFSEISKKSLIFARFPENPDFQNPETPFRDTFERLPTTDYGLLTTDYTDNDNPDPPLHTPANPIRATQRSLTAIYTI